MVDGTVNAENAALRERVQEMRENYEGACKTIAEMHEAATGRRGEAPIRGVIEDCAQIRTERDNWEETAAQHCRNEQYYRALVVQVGELFGAEARTCDDGSVAEDVLCAKVPELTTKLRERVARLEEALGKLTDLAVKASNAEVELACAPAEPLFPGHMNPVPVQSYRDRAKTAWAEFDTVISAALSAPSTWLAEQLAAARREGAREALEAVIDEGYKTFSGGHPVIAWLDAKAEAAREEER